MPRGKQFVIGCMSDALSALHCERACAALREAHPHAEFVSAAETAARPAAGQTRGRAGRAKSAITDAVCASEPPRHHDGRRAGGAVVRRLAKGEIDIGVVDARRIPLQLPEPIEIAAVLERTNPFDVLISCEDLILDEQPENTCIAVLDAVKRGQLLYYRPDLRLVEAPDDFDGLFDAMQRGDIDAFVYPAADVEALNRQMHVVEVFTTSICTPPGGQGAQVLLVRRDRRDIGALVRGLNDPSSAAEIELERMLLEHLARDGRGPVGVLGNVEESVFELEAAIAAPDGTEKISATAGGSLAERSKIVMRLAAELLASGGDEILAPYRRARGGG